MCYASAICQALYIRSSLNTLSDFNSYEDLRLYCYSHLIKAQRTQITMRILEQASWTLKFVLCLQLLRIHWPQVNLKGKLCVRSRALWQLWPTPEADRSGNSKVTREDTCFLERIARRKNSYPLTSSVRFFKTWGQYALKEGCAVTRPFAKMKCSRKQEVRWGGRTRGGGSYFN